jgi:hypothetical protein
MALYKRNAHPNRFVGIMRGLYDPLGFTKGYNFAFFLIFAGAMFGFELASTPKMDVTGYWLTHVLPSEPVSFSSEIWEE